MASIWEHLGNSNLMASFLFSQKIRKLQKMMLMSLQTLTSSSQALEGENCFHACDRYLLSYLRKFLLVNKVFDLFFAFGRQCHAASLQTSRGEEWTVCEWYIIPLSNIFNPSSYVISRLLSFELRKFIYKAFCKSLHFFNRVMSAQ